jgi:hypothetical protein
VDWVVDLWFAVADVALVVFQSHRAPIRTARRSASALGPKTTRDNRHPAPRLDIEPTKRRLSFNGGCHFNGECATSICTFRG